MNNVPTLCDWLGGLPALNRLTPSAHRARSFVRLGTVRRVGGRERDGRGWPIARP